MANKKWSDLQMNLRLKFPNNYTFNMNASFATYAYQFDKSGNIVVGDRTEWSYGRFGRFQGYSGSFSYTLNNDTFKKLFGKKEDKEDKNKENSRKKVKRKKTAQRISRRPIPTCVKRKLLRWIRTDIWPLSFHGV